MTHTRPGGPPPGLRAVALPTEHGGWGLTLEPGLLGLLVAPGAAGACLALAAIVAFTARTPLKLVLVDLRRGRRLERTRLATRVAAAELVVLTSLVVAAAALADGRFWIPALAAVPLIAVESWFEVQSRGRRLVPELAGATGVCAASAMIVLAGGGDGRLAAALWVILSARVVTSIPFVRAQVAHLRGRSTRAHHLLVADASALAGATLAVALDGDVLVGALAVVTVVVVQRLTARRPVPRPAVLGMRQMALGFGVVFATAIGVLVTAA